jgi:hypothetical protein
MDKTTAGFYQYKHLERRMFLVEQEMEGEENIGEPKFTELEKKAENS